MLVFLLIVGFLAAVVGVLSGVSGVAIPIGRSIFHGGFFLFGSFILLFIFPDVVTRFEELNVSPGLLTWMAILGGYCNWAMAVYCLSHAAAKFQFHGR